MIFLLSMLFCCQSILSYQKSLVEFDEILLSRTISKSKKKRYIKPYLSLVQSIEYDESIAIHFTLPPLKENDNKYRGKTFRPFNPSILKTEHGYDVICRTSNFNLPDYKPIIPNDVIRNRNFFLRYDKDFNLLYEQEIPSIRSPIAERIDKNSQLQDCRLFYWNGSYWFIGIGLIKKRSLGLKLRKGKYLPKPVVCRLNYLDNGTSVSIQSFKPFFGPKVRRPEKNWLPFIDEGKLRFIYLYYPFIILEPNLEKGTCETVLRYKPTQDFSRFRGSAAPIEFENGYLMMIHECYPRRHYVHRFLYLDKQFRITRISRPFSFGFSKVEFCTSMTIDHSGKNLVIPIGVYDREAKIILVSLEYVKTLLQDILL